MEADSRPRRGRWEEKYRIATKSGDRQICTLAGSRLSSFLAVTADSLPAEASGEGRVLVGISPPLFRSL
ncbi:MAG: hypothetical protein ACKO2G_02475 [Verrucomicrobiales bacterium]